MRTSSQRASPEPEPKPGNGRFPDAWGVAEAASVAPKPPPRLTSAEAVDDPKGPSASPAATRPAEANRFAAFPAKGASHPRSAEAVRKRKTRS
jgi:hypothetical protein